MRRAGVFGEGIVPLCVFYMVFGGRSEFTVNLNPCLLPLFLFPLAFLLNARLCTKLPLVLLLTIPSSLYSSLITINYVNYLRLRLFVRRSTQQNNSNIIFLQRATTTRTSEYKRRRTQLLDFFSSTNNCHRHKLPLHPPPTLFPPPPPPQHTDTDPSSLMSYARRFLLDSSPSTKPGPVMAEAGFSRFLDLTPPPPSQTLLAH